VNKTGDVSENGQQDVDPKGQSDTDLEKHAEWGNQNGEENTNQICHAGAGNEGMNVSAGRASVPDTHVLLYGENESGMQ
jgi:hypothetical protein